MVEDDVSQYRAAWRRILASTIDAVLLIPVGELQEHSRASLWAGVALSAISGLLSVSYFIAGHALFGMTVGKWICRIQVLTLKGGLPGWRRAILRDVVPLAIVVASVALGTLSAAAPDTLAPGSDDANRLELILGLGFLGWTLLELVTMLANKRRRAVHDLIAGTVVVKVTRPRQ